MEAKANSLELSPHNAARVSELIREGRAGLEVLVYPWGVEFTVSSPRHVTEEQDFDKLPISEREEEVQSFMQRAAVEGGESDGV